WRIKLTAVPQFRQSSSQAQARFQCRILLIQCPALQVMQNSCFDLLLLLLHSHSSTLGSLFPSRPAWLWPLR
ncbi:hypothetical protein KI387_029892, partial [Taxus chinensis]